MSASGPPELAPHEVEALAQHVAERVAAIPGVECVVLGGSRARGAAFADSDVDLGLYYADERALDLAALRALARGLDERGSAAEVTEPGAWGPWVNGGAWLRIDGVAVDWLYRDLERVRAVVADGVAGRTHCDYYLGHPHGFHSHIYLGEVHCARPLAGRAGALEELKRAIDPYPALLRAEIVRRYTYDAQFMLAGAAKSAARADVLHTSGCLFRVVAALVQVLFALNERWFLNEKGSLAAVEGFAIRPRRFRERAEALLAAPGSAAPGLERSVAEARSLVDETRELCPPAA